MFAGESLHCKICGARNEWHLRANVLPLPNAFFLLYCRSIQLLSLVRALGGSSRPFFDAEIRSRCLQVYKLKKILRISRRERSTKRASRRNSQSKDDRWGILAALQAGDTRYTTVHIIVLTTAPEPVGHTVFPSSPNPIVVSLKIFRFFLKLSILSKNPVLNLYL